MNHLKNTLIAALTLSAAINVNAKPAKPGNYVVTQPDGTTLTIHTIGNAFCHYTLTDDDKIVLRESDGQYCYAKFNTNGTLLSTGVQAHNSSVRPVDEAELAVDLSAAPQATPAKARMLVNAKANMGKSEYDFPTEGNIRGLLLLVNFADESFKTDSYYQTNAKDFFTNMMNQEGFSEYGGTGSAKDYFKEMSKGKFNLTVDVAGPYTVSENYAYYGANDTYGEDAHPDEMIAEACVLADADVNFADYDNDGDGYCDFVYVIYAGIGESDHTDQTNRIWPHAYNLSYTQQHKTLDGVVVDRYACSNEWASSTPDGVGTFVHEFSHVLGLPDIYYTGSGSWLYCTPGYYDMLDVGCYNNDARTPPAYSAYERFAMDWIDLKELNDAENVTLRNLQDYNEACIIKTSKETEFFLLENRQQSGWDEYIPGHGMLIWHLDCTQRQFTNNTVNNNKAHQYVDIVEANNNPDSSKTSYSRGWPWPGTSNKTEFTSSTTPALKDWSSKAIDMPITDITETKGVITFKVKGGSTDGVDDIISDSANTENAEYFNLQGIKVSNPAHGLYIERKGNSAAVKKF
jgi:M6 family metalloprotease-like protein